MFTWRRKTTWKHKNKIPAEGKVVRYRSWGGKNYPVMEGEDPLKYRPVPKGMRRKKLKSAYRKPPFSHPDAQPKIKSKK